MYQYLWSARSSDGRTMYAAVRVAEELLENMEVFKLAERDALAKLAEMDPDYADLRFEEIKRIH